MPILTACADPLPQWHAHIALAQLSEIFRAQGWQTPSPIESIRVTRRSATGRAELLEVTGRGAPAQLSASSFRFAVDRALGWNQMRSDWYTVTVSGSRPGKLQGKGYRARRRPVPGGRL